MPRISIKKENGLSTLRSDFDLYPMLLPCRCFFIMFKYVTVIGIFISWIIVFDILTNLLKAQNSLINRVLVAAGMVPIMYLAQVRRSEGT